MNGSSSRANSDFAGIELAVDAMEIAGSICVCSIFGRFEAHPVGFDTSFRVLFLFVLSGDH
jgi:hypothetical protein